MFNRFAHVHQSNGSMAMVLIHEVHVSESK